MDGPQVERVSAMIKGNRLINFLAALERSYYRRIMMPDLLIVLRVNPEICVQRKVDETPDSVRSRSQEIWNLDWSDSFAQIVDGSQPKSKVSTAVLNLAWAYL